MKLSKQQLSDYRKLGIVKIKLSKKILKQKEIFINDSIKFFKNFDKKNYPKNLNKNKLQEYLLSIRKSNRDLISKYYKISRRFASLKSLIASNEFIKINKQLMETKLVSICHFIALRIDFYQEREKKYITDIHQDFPYIQGSLNGVTFWMPIYSTQTAPEYIPGSHKLGLQKFKEFSINKKSGTKTLEMVKDASNQKKFRKASCKFNEMLIFNTLLIHRSSKKKYQKPRLSLQFRYDDISQKKMFDKNYPEGLYLGDKFKKNFKQYVI